MNHIEIELRYHILNTQQLVPFLAPLKTAYGTLLLRKKDFAHYLLGRFILEEDRV